MSRPRAENRLSGAERERLSRAIATRMVAAGDYRRIYEDLGVGQPFVSLALHGRLVAWTGKVGKLFEYLGLERDDPSVANLSRENRSDHQTMGIRSLADPVAALFALSDGTREQDGRLIDLLDAVRRFTELRRKDPMESAAVDSH